MVNNLGRVQGVVIGSIVGQIINTLFESCEAWSVTALSVCLFLYAVCSLFLFYNSTHYGFLGMLLAGFGCSQMLASSCGVHSLDKTKGYEQMIGMVTATALIVFFDLVFSPERASDAAHRELGAAVDLLGGALGRHFDRSVKRVRFHRGELQSAIARAETLGKEASQEPRFWRTAWRESIFRAFVDTAYRTRRSMTGMEYSMAEGFTDGGRKNGVLCLIQSMPSWGQLVEVVARRVMAVRLLVDIFAHETQGSFPGFSDPCAMHDRRQELRAAMRSLAAELAKHPAMGSPTAAKTLEEDPICQVCAMFGAVSSIMTELQALQHEIRRGD